MTNAPPLPGESPRDALARRLAETADKEVWNGSTLVGPHRDDLVFELGGRDLATFASRGQQRTAILALKLAELDVVTAIDGRPPLLLLDDVFSELDPERRSHLVRRIAALPAGVHHDDHARRPRSRAAGDRDRLGGPARTGRGRPAGRRRRRAAMSVGGGGPMSAPRRRPMVRLGDLIPDAARALGLEDELRLSRGHRDLRGARRRARPGRRRRLPRRPARRLHARRRGRCADRRPGAAPPRAGAPDRLRDGAGRGRRPRVARPRPSRGSPRIIPLTCQPPLRRPIAAQAQPGLDRTSVRPSRDPGSQGPPDHERPGWPYGSR